MMNGASSLLMILKTTFGMFMAILYRLLNNRELMENSNKVIKKQHLINLIVTSVVEIDGSDYKYQGEVDIDNKPHGFGVASDTSYNTLTEK